MNHWRIVSGHWNPKDTDETKSVILGDWLRHNYVSIGYGKKDVQYLTFKDKVKVDDKIVVTTDGYVWALGTVVSEIYDKEVSSNSYLYEHRRDVVWSTVTKVRFTAFPKSLRNKLGLLRGINFLKPEDWETLLMFV
ncbi:MAG: hypothetical protein ACLP9K_09945 [Nitrososphaerales archaeon]